MLKKSLFAGLAVTAAVGLAACGDDNDKSSGASTPAPAPAQPQTGAGDTGGAAAETGGGATIALAADPSGSLAFDKKALSAKAGKVKLTFTNESQTPHNVEIEQKGGEEAGVTETIQGSTTSKDLDLKAGEYEFYCTVDGHRQAGMEGKLTVK